MSRLVHLQMSRRWYLLLVFLFILISATYANSFIDIFSNFIENFRAEDPNPTPEEAPFASIPLVSHDESSCAAPPIPSSPPSPVILENRHILFVTIAMKSHAQPLLRVASAMKEQGYRVSFATHDSGREWVEAYKLPFISAGSFPISSDNLREKLQAISRDTSRLNGLVTMFKDIYVEAASPMYDALLLKLKNTEFVPDLLVLDIATIGAQFLAQKLQIPYVLNSPSLLFDLGSVPNYVPAYGTGFRQDMSLWDRCVNLLYPTLLSMALTSPFMVLNQIRDDVGLPLFRSQNDLFNGARIILNTAFGLEYPQPLSPFVDAVGPLLPLPTGNAKNLEHQLLPAELLSWLDASVLSTPSSGGIIYVNFGTMVYIDAWQAQALVDGLVAEAKASSLKVLWILPADQHDVLPRRLPSLILLKTPDSSLLNLEILGHPAVTVVLSHCGMTSAQEALVMKKPLICIPFLGDQLDVAARVVDSRAGLMLDKNSLSGLFIHAALTELRTNASYRNAARKVGVLLIRGGGTARAIDVIDAALQVGFDHLVTPEMTMPWHRAALLDVGALYIALICLLVVFLRVTSLLLYHLVFISLHHYKENTSLCPASLIEAQNEICEDEGEGSSDSSQSVI
ncbi:hypothetical protein CCR75_008090 [Bremia lactucae]|uniref:Uncharacterized protein n=1 Tax=Bremia lactucae TaxID=4779 RepID=A0A976IJJ4_BRELC|nr:hypothetical protein CCR75_008090 [Bremia lactucae]